MKISLGNTLVLFTLSLSTWTHGQSDIETDSSGEVYKIEGKVSPPDNPPLDWLSITTVTIDGGKRRAFLKDDNSFVFQVILDRETMTDWLNPRVFHPELSLLRWRTLTTCTSKSG